MDVSSDISLRQHVDFRQKLHSLPDLSGREVQTAALVQAYLTQFSPTRLVPHIGGSGLAAVFQSKTPGKRVLFRCELDALPIVETNTFTYASKVPGVSHKCGHDGHMAIMCALGELLSKSPPASGEVVLLFQPAEETGEGAARIVHSDQFPEIAPDFAFSLHNVPGFPLGSVICKNETIMCGSVGMKITLAGRSAHAATPEQGVNPVAAVSTLLNELPSIPKKFTGSSINLLTVTHCKIGEPSFGISPGDAVIQLVVRSDDRENLEALKSGVRACVNKIANASNLQVMIELHDDFPVSRNDVTACNFFRRAACELALQTIEKETPFLWSEDFAHFSNRYCGAMIGLGSGDIPPLHSPDYDFPDSLIPVGAKLFYRIARSVLG